MVKSFPRCVRVFLILLCAFAALTPATFAQDNTVWNKINGNWNVSFQDQKLGQVVGAVTVTPKKVVGTFFYPKGEQSFTTEPTFDGTTLKVNYWPYFDGVRSQITLSGNGATLSGTWTEQGTDSKTPSREGQRTYDDPGKKTGRPEVIVLPARKSGRAPSRK
jgi:hypothetical protein